MEKQKKKIYRYYDMSLTLNTTVVIYHTTYAHSIVMTYMYMYVGL